jgi:hypothetical protein
VGKPAVYRGRREIPDVLDQLCCHGSCHSEYGHASLLSCTDGHASTRGIGMNEALDASRLTKEGGDVQRTRSSIDRRHGSRSRRAVGGRGRA